MLNKILYFFIIVLLLTNCDGHQNQDTSVGFFPLNALEYSEINTDVRGNKYLFKTEHIVISNAPFNRNKLESIVEEYNVKTKAVLIAKEYYSYRRYFYRETKFTPRDYAEFDKGFFDGWDTIDRHKNDLITSVTWNNYGKSKEGVFYDPPLQKSFIESLFTQFGLSNKQ